MNQQIFLLFSKYSKACENWIKRFQTCPIELKINNICVDNSMIRKKMFESQNIHISKLPCIIIYSQNTPTIYEGMLAFQWLENITQQFLNMSKLSKEQVAAPAKHIVLNAPSHATPLNDLEFEEEEYTESEEETEAPPQTLSGMNPKKPTPADQKKISIAEKIAQMQKERDNEEEKIKSIKHPEKAASVIKPEISTDKGTGSGPFGAAVKKRKKKIVMKSTN